MRFDLLNSPAAVEKIAEEWGRLYEKCGRGIFGNYGWHRLWWLHLGASSGVRLHIVTARSASGELIGILPLITRRGFGLRIAGWAGTEAFDYGDVLAPDVETAKALWNFVRESRAYDIALMYDVSESALCLPVLARYMGVRRQKRSYFLSLDFASGEAWLDAQSRKLRGDTRRKMEKMQARGPVEIHFYRRGEAVPDAVIDALYAQKREWFAARKAKGVFARVEVKEFLHDLARDAARSDMLYLSWISCGSTVVACHIGFIREGILYLYHTTYDAAYGAFSPGNILMVETIKTAIDAGLRELDFMRGDEAYKGRLANGQRTLVSYVEARSLLGKMAVALQSYTTRANTVAEERND